MGGGTPPPAPRRLELGAGANFQLAPLESTSPSTMLLYSIQCALALALAPPTALQPRAVFTVGHRAAVRLQADVSPFDADTEVEAADYSSSSSDKPQLELTMDNVELVLDDMRPYLIADGGNVAVVEIDGGVVRLELQGACGSCPSSTMTMKMGLERGLRERIPEIIAVEQVAPDGPQLTEEGIEEVLDEIRPFLKMAGGSVDLVQLDPDGVMPEAKLAITGNGSTINSVRAEIAQRLKRNVRCFGSAPARTCTRFLLSALPSHEIP